MKPGSTVHVAGAGPVGLAAAAGAQLLGAAVVIVGDLQEERLAQARSFGCETVDVSKGDPKDQIEQIRGMPEVDAGIDEAAEVGSLPLSLGTGWAKSLSFTTGQCPVMRYNLGLMKAILHDRVQIAKAVNATVISLDDAPRGYQEFDKGAARKYVIDPHGTLAA